MPMWDTHEVSFVDQSQLWGVQMLLDVRSSDIRLDAHVVDHRSSSSVDSATFGFSGASPAPAERMTVHVLADAAHFRATIARIIFATGHHAEVYSDIAELVGHRPSAGIVMVHDESRQGVAEVCAALEACGFWLPVIGLAVEVRAERIVAAMKAGAMDFLVGEPSVELLGAKLAKCAHEAGAVAQARIRRADAHAAIARLSTRERQVLELMAAGMSNKAMARELGLSPRTVEIHRMKMMGKIGADSCARAVRMLMDGLGS